MAVKQHKTNVMLRHAISILEKLNQLKLNINTVQPTQGEINHIQSQADAGQNLAGQKKHTYFYEKFSLHGHAGSPSLFFCYHVPDMAAIKKRTMNEII